MLQGIGIKNIRSIKDSGLIETKPITVLVGKNSCGKSTFARIFPLLRQSVEVKTMGPVLWFGRLVDFGTLSDALNINEKEIEFYFSVSLEKGQSLSTYQSQTFPMFFNPLEGTILSDTKVDASFTVTNDKDGTPYTKKIRIEIFKNTIEILCSEKKSVTQISINGEEIFPAKSTLENLTITEGQLFPVLKSTRELKYRIGRSSKPRKERREVPPFVVGLMRTVKSMSHHNTGYGTITNIVERSALGTDKQLISHYGNIPNSGSYWRNKISNMHSNNSEFQRLKTSILAAHIPVLLSRIDSICSQTFINTRYIEPLRATAQRYYRVQELAVDEIDPKGENIAMYLKNLTRSQLEDFNNWCTKSLGFSIRQKTIFGQTSIELRENNTNIEKNMADMGFGFSQLLPIALQIWDARRSSKPSDRVSARFGVTTRSRRRRRMIVIEQPELHLHPAFQSKLADIFSSVSESEEKSTNLVIETHSNHMINRFGELISEGLLSPEDIQIIRFERNNENSTTNLIKTEFDKKGILKDWPVGFMEPDF